MSDIADKWGVMVAERGFAQIPNYLLLLNTFVIEENKLTPIELLVLIQLVGAWWQKDQLPFPSMATLAKRTGVSERQVQRAVARLLKLNYLGRVSRRSKGIIASNAYDLTPLVKVLEEIARAFPNAFPRATAKRPKRIPAPKPRSPEEVFGADPVILPPGATRTPVKK